MRIWIQVVDFKIYNIGHQIRYGTGTWSGSVRTVTISKICLKCWIRIRIEPKRLHDTVSKIQNLWHIGPAVPWYFFARKPWKVLVPSLLTLRPSCFSVSWSTCIFWSFLGRGGWVAAGRGAGYTYTTWATLYTVVSQYPRLCLWRVIFSNPLKDFISQFCARDY